MSAIEEKDSMNTYFINGKNLSGASVTLFIRSQSSREGALVPLDRIIARVVFPLAHYDEMRANFSEKGAVIFDIHRGSRPTLSVTAVISEIKKRDDAGAALLEFVIL